MGEAFDDGEFGVSEEVSRRWRLEEVLAGVRRERKRRLGKVISFGADFFPSFQVCVAGESKAEGCNGILWGAKQRTWRKRSYTGRWDG